MKTLSLVIPVYGTEKYLKRCIESVLNQNFKNLEIIFVDDCSPGNAGQIIKEYQEKDDRIKYIRHEENRGLFQSRLTGAKKATGDYIAFLDSDDYVAFDYYYVMIKKAEESEADIVIGNTVREREDGSHYVIHFHNCSLNFEYLEGREITEKFWGQEGRCYSWHTVWNKIYNKKLWDRAFPFFQNITTHVIMTEDIAFSSILFYFAEKVARVNSSACFYCENTGASTDSRHITLKKFIKNMTDITTVFDFVGGFLRDQEADPFILQSYDSFREYYAKMYLDLAIGVFSGAEKEEAFVYVNKLYPDLASQIRPEDYFYDSLQTNWSDGSERAKTIISDSEIKYVSFDIFDTLILRPLYEPQHVFELLDRDFKELVQTNLSFATLRIEGEKAARRKLGLEKPEYQDVTLDEIYDCICQDFGLDMNIAQIMQKREEELEITLSYCRNTGKELFELAQSLGKHIILVSDMYLKRQTIEIMLKKNGYEGYEKLYLSSDIRLAKYTGDLFKFVLNDLSVEGKIVLHIGDTWKNDYENSRRAGIKAFFFPKALEVFENKIQGYPTNRCSVIGNWAAAGVFKQNTHKESIGYGAMVAIVANKYFDNPYRTFHGGSDFNVDPYFMGYYLVGMHVYGLVKWLLEQSQLYGYRVLYFMSRDGYLPMKVYQMMTEGEQEAPRAEYLYSSRKAVMPYIMKEPLDLFDFPTVVTNQCANTMKRMLSFCMEDIDQVEYQKRLKCRGIEADERFSDRAAYIRFVKIFLEEFYSQKVHDQSKRLCSDYYSRIVSEGATVDMGYSGRIQGAISEAVGRGVDVFFVHANSNQYIKEERNHNFRIHSFYGCEPCVSGVFREHLFSSFDPSCVGFERNGECVKPVFENDEKEPQDRWVISEIHRGAIDFVSDFMEKLGKYRNDISVKPQEISLPYEGFLRFSRPLDLKVFSASFFEDEIWGGSSRINIADFLENQHVTFEAENAFPEKQIVIERIMENDPFVEKIRNKFRRYPYLFKLLKRVYNSFR